MAEIVDPTVKTDRHVWAFVLNDLIHAFAKLVVEAIKYLSEQSAVRMPNYWTMVAILVTGSILL
jgi:hypothetical protein